MSNLFHRILDPQTISGDMDQGVFEALDAGNYKELDISIRVMKAGSAGVVRLQHAAINRDDAYIDLDGTNVNLNATSDNFVQVTAFLRYIRWRTDTSTAGSPVVTIDVIAKN